MSGTGRFAPSPSGELHVGNLRTAALAWLAARSSRRSFLLRIEDLDEQRSRAEHAARQLADLASIGLDWDAEPIHQSSRLADYQDALNHLIADGYTFECFCSRQEIREAQSAPHAGSARYPGTCRALSDTERARQRRSARPATIRLRANDVERGWHDLVLGAQTGLADDVVLRRWDGALAYNLAVVVDDTWQTVDQVVRGDDLVDQTATQILLAELLGGAIPDYGHVPLVVNAQGRRLAKRDGAVTLTDLRARGVSPEQVVQQILDSLGPAAPRNATDFAAAADGFDPAQLPRAPWVFTPPVGC